MRVPSRSHIDCACRRLVLRAIIDMIQQVSPIDGSRGRSRSVISSVDDAGRVAHALAERCSAGVARASTRDAAVEPPRVARHSRFFPLLRSYNSHLTCATLVPVQPLGRGDHFVGERDRVRLLSERGDLRDTTRRSMALEYAGRARITPRLVEVEVLVRVLRVGIDLLPLREVLVRRGQTADGGRHGGELGGGEVDVGALREAERNSARCMCAQGLG